MMSSALSKELRAKHGVNSMPIRSGDSVIVTRGSFKGREGKVTQVYRRRWVIHVERIQRDKVNGQQVSVGISPSNVTITALKIDRDRAELLKKKAATSTAMQA
jgi:large subunit ribosomal protein L26e